MLTRGRIHKRKYEKSRKNIFQIIKKSLKNQLKIFKKIKIRNQGSITEVFMQGNKMFKGRTFETEWMSTYL